METNDDNTNCLKDVIRPGAVLVSHGPRGSGKTHCAVSICQNIMQGCYPDMPEHVVLISNLSFAQRTNTGFAIQSPPGVHKIRKMDDVLPIIAETLENDNDAMIILLLDEAQGIIQDKLSKDEDIDVSMREFCEVARELKICLWFLTPNLNSLHPALRNFADAGDDPGYVTCTVQTDVSKSAIHVQKGSEAPIESVPMPTSSWMREADSLNIGEFTCCASSSANFNIAKFPIHDLLTDILERPNNEAVSVIREFMARPKRARGTKNHTDA